MSDRMTNVRQRKVIMIRWRRRLTDLARALGYGLRACRECNGYGWVPEQARGYEGEPIDGAVQAPCYPCRGTGRAT